MVIKRRIPWCLTQAHSAASLVGLTVHGSLTEFEVSFAAASRNYGIAYMMFQEAISKYNDTDSGSQVSVENYASLFPIFAFNVSHHK